MQALSTGPIEHFPLCRAEPSDTCLAEYRAELHKILCIEKKFSLSYTFPTCMKSEFLSCGPP